MCGGVESCPCEQNIERRFRFVYVQGNKKVPKRNRESRDGSIVSWGLKNSLDASQLSAHQSPWLLLRCLMSAAAFRQSNERGWTYRPSPPPYPPYHADRDPFFPCDECVGWCRKREWRPWWVCAGWTRGNRWGSLCRGSVYEPGGRSLEGGKRHGAEFRSGKKELVIWGD